MNIANAKRFDYIDIIIMHADHETLPWFDSNIKALQLMKQIVFTNK